MSGSGALPRPWRRLKVVERRSRRAAAALPARVRASGAVFTAKDFRTWAGTVMAAKALAGVASFASAAEARRNIVKAVEQAAKRLGNTKAVCRKCYIHPAVIDAYMDGVTLATPGARATRSPGSRPALSQEEAGVVGLIERRFLKTA